MEPGARDMQELNGSVAIWLFALVQLLGWTGGLLARVSTRSRHQTACYSLFLLALVVVGISTSLLLCLGASCCLLSRKTLAGMIWLAICDFDRHGRPATI